MQETLKDGNCGGCGSRIAFINVMLCERCLHARLTPHDEGDEAGADRPLEAPAFLPFLQTAYS